MVGKRTGSGGTPRVTDSKPVTVMKIFGWTAIYLMPYFQRRYEWQAKKHVLDFWKDLMKVTEGESDLAFLGAVVLREEESADSSSPAQLVVIDGQQRLMTFYLTILAMTVYAERKNWPVAKDGYKYLLSDQSEAQDHPKVMPTREDYTQFNLLLKKLSGERGAKLLPESGERGGHMTSAYTTLFSQIESYLKPHERDVEMAQEFYRELYNALLNKVQVIQITLGDEQNPNEVFARLNAQKKDLRILDLVRNHVFQTVHKPEEAERLHAHKWQEFENQLKEGAEKEEDSEALRTKKREKQENDFFFPYTLINSPKATKNRLYTEILRYWASAGLQEKSGGDGYRHAEAIISDMSAYVPYYLALHADRRPPLFVDEKAWETISRINTIPLPGTTYPFLMQVIKAVAEKGMRKSDAIRVFRILESFFVRRALCGFEPTGIHAIFKGLWDESNEGAPELVLGKIQTRTIKFPEDEDLKRSITGESLPVRIRKYVLLEYERHLQEKSGDAWLPPADCQTDHVMPKSAVKQPRRGRSSGDDLPLTRGDFERLVDSWGNLTLIGKGHNLRKQDKEISQADRRLGLRENTNFRSVKEVLDKFLIDEWDVAAIQRRGEHMAKWAVRRWPKKV